jgi:hypothetical protein
MRYKLLILFFIVAVNDNCSNNKYAATNKLYKKQVKTFAKALRA